MPVSSSPHKQSRSVFYYYGRATLKHPVALVVVLASAITNQLMYVFAPLYLKRIVDTFAAGGPTEERYAIVLQALVIYGAFEIAGWLLMRIRAFTTNFMAIRIMANLANEAFGNLMRHSHEFFINNFVGSLTQKVTRYSRAYTQMFDILVANMLPVLVYSVGSIVVVYTRSPILGLILGGWVIAFLLVQYFLTRWKRAIRAARVAAETRMSGSVSDVVGNQSAVALFAAAEAERGEFATVVATWHAATLRAWNSTQIIQSVQAALGVGIEVGLLFMLAHYWQLGLVTVGDFVLVQVYVMAIVNGVWGIGNALQALFEGVADAQEMVDIFELEPTVRDTANAGLLKTAAGEIRFDQVSFSYNSDRDILKALDLTIRGGEKVAFVGPSGAGKSTVIKLLLRQYDVTSGAISIDGQDIREVTQDSLHEAIAFVPQESVLFHRTLRENIAYGKRDATEEEIIAAAKAAHCHDFIAALPEGYGTYVGERGVKLSGGERQRVAIARAILKNAPILVLDEATSSLDSESEALIQDALAKLMEGKTVIAIAHRLSTIMKMDRIIVMEGGAMVLSGTHNELLAQESNLYKKLWEIQAGSFVADEG